MNSEKALIKEGINIDNQEYPNKSTILIASMLTLGKEKEVKELIGSDKFLNYQLRRFKRAIKKSNKSFTKKQIERAKEFEKRLIKHLKSVALKEHKEINSKRSRLSKTHSRLKEQSRSWRNKMKKEELLLEDRKRLLSKTEEKIKELKKHYSNKTNDVYALREREDFARSLKRDIRLLETGKGYLILRRIKKFLKGMREELKQFKQDKKEAEMLIKEREKLIPIIKENITKFGGHDNKVMNRRDEKKR